MVVLLLVNECLLLWVMVECVLVYWQYFVYWSNEICVDVCLLIFVVKGMVSSIVDIVVMVVVMVYYFGYLLDEIIFVQFCVLIEFIDSIVFYQLMLFDYNNVVM